MQIALTRPSIVSNLSRALDAAKSFATSFANARKAAAAIERYQSMTDAELALRGLDRETLNMVVVSRYMK